MTDFPGPPPTPVEPYKVRVFLVSGEWVDVLVSVPWPKWVENYHAYGGVIHEKGLIERLAVKYIVHIDADGTPAQKFEGNVVPIKRS